MVSNLLQKGLGLLHVKDLTEVKSMFMRALEIHTSKGLGFRILSAYSLKVYENEQIESIFTEYVIKDVWNTKYVFNDNNPCEPMHCVVYSSF